MPYTNINFEIKPLMFCLDNNPLVFNAVNSDSKYVSLEISMFFNAYNQIYSVTQTYEEALMNGRATFYPGEEINDFFPEIESFVPSINNDGILKTSFLMNAAKVNLIIRELDERKENNAGVLNFNNLKYIPGKKPKAFPYLTNGRRRCTYNNSLIILSATEKDIEEENLGDISGETPLIHTPAQTDMVSYMTFKRKKANDNLLRAICNHFICFNPLPEIDEHIDVVFINQNLCPDIMSFSGEYEEYPELTHILSKKGESGVDFKAQVKRKRTLKLNTGWLFKEELNLLEELIESKICFINIENKWENYIPISKKPIGYNSEKTQYAQMVEFKKINYER